MQKTEDILKAVEILGVASGVVPTTLPRQNKQTEATR